jgi:hypothetical protein
MAERKQSDRKEEVGVEDVVEVGSRISWSAILAGAVMSLAVCFVMMLLGQSLGISVSDRTNADSLGFGSALWAVVTSVVGLFIGGWIASQCVVGETKTEAAIHGVIMWGAAMALFMWGTASGVNANFTAMTQVASIAGVMTEPDHRNDTMSGPARAIPQANAERVTRPDNRDADNSRAPATSEGVEPRTAERRATRATWWTLANVVLSMFAAAGGALAGAGPTFRLVPLHVAHHDFAGRRAVSGNV